MLRDILQRVPTPLSYNKELTNQTQKNFQTKNEVTRDECKRKTNTDTKGYKGKQT